MVESINTKAELVTNATSYLNMGTYGKIMIGDNGFEFFNEKNASDFIQIPWTEVDQVIVSVIFKGKWIPRYAVKTKNNGTFTFASKDPKKVLRTIRNHVDPENIVKSLGLLDVFKRRIKLIFKH